MNWQTLFTSYAGALGGTATALVVVGFFGKTLFEHWFKKDFKRFEATLDALASRDETKFAYIYGKRAPAIDELHRLCISLKTNADAVILGGMFLNHDNPEYRETGKKVETFVEALRDNLKAIFELIQANRLVFDDKVFAAVKDLTDYCGGLLAKESLAEKGKDVVKWEAVDSRIVAVEKIFRGLLGSDIV